MSDKPHILFFMCLEDRGGAEISMVRQAQGLLVRGFRVTFAVHSRTAVSASRLTKELGFTGDIIDFGQCRSLAVCVPLFQLLRVGRYDTIISALTHTNLVAIVAVRLASLVASHRTRVLISEHGVDGVDACAASRPFALLTRFLYARADVVITVSQALAQAWRGFLSRRTTLTTIYNPVIGDSVSLPPAHPWLAHKTMPVIIGIGRLQPEKNFDLLIRAFAQMIHEEKARLVILGEGSERPMLESLIRELGLGESVLMPGFAPHPQAWLAYADLFVCPSKTEGFGNVIVEALACGIPVVATNCPYGPAEILKQGRYGRLVPVDDSAAMARAMADSLSLPADTNYLIARAQDFSISRNLDAYVALLEQNIIIATQELASCLPANRFLWHLRGTAYQFLNCDRYNSEQSSLDMPSPFHRFTRWLHSVFFYEHWMIGIVDQPIRNALTWDAAPDVRWIEGFDKKNYYADPFPWPGSTDTLLCEDYDILDRMGRISALKLDANGVAIAIDAKFPVTGHLSFPFIFMHDNNVYAMPESSAARRLEILRWDEQKGIWVNHVTVFDDLPAADAALFEKDGLFWISYTDVTHDPHDNLNLIYAATLTGPWLRHPANPVMYGRGNSRNGGSVFDVDGKLYRPAQDCSNHYGGALRIMEITEWTTTAYAEREVTHIMPTSPLYPDGFHSLVAWGDKCLVDGMRLTFSPQLVWHKIKRRLRLS